MVFLSGGNARATIGPGRFCVPATDRVEPGSCYDHELLHCTIQY
jgi:hypothetical protein